MPQSLAAGSAWWKLAFALDRQADHLIDHLDGCPTDAKVRVLEELLHTLDAQRELLRCGIDALRPQAGAPPGVRRSGTDHTH